MRVLVACEFSGIVRRAFRALGHDAWSCDLLDAEDNDAHHIVGDALDTAAAFKPDLMIAHPPCTFLTNAGVRWLYLDGRKVNGPDPVRWKSMNAAVEFFKKCQAVDVPRLAVENPIPHGHANLGRPTQIVQPWMFGHKEIKATCFWLKGLKPLVETDNVYAGTMALPYAQRALVHYASPGPDRWQERSRTLPGIAAAMAEQWTILPKDPAHD